jgi:hypothetical protein
MKFMKTLCLFAAWVLLLTMSGQKASAQGAGTIHGQVTDPSSAVVPNATVHISGAGQSRSETTDGSGKYTVTLPPGQYTIKVEAPGFVASSQQSVTLAAGQNSPLDIALQISTAVQQVDVNESGVGQVSTDPSTNASAIVLNTSDIDALPDDPDDLQSQLQAMAGPSAGPNGAQFFVDGFSGGQLPPKSSIREVRINSNPFASEFDRPGFGRIEILTRPGTDSLHGSAFMTYGNRIFDTRNPYVTGELPDYNSRMESFNLGGPFMKKYSWTIDFNQRVFNDESLVNAQALDANLNKISINDTFPTPSHSWNISPRVDYAINQNNTLILRYSHQDTESTSGVGGFNLPTQTTMGNSKFTTAQVTETMVIGTKAVNEARFQFQDSRSNTSGAGFSGTTINVSGSFTSGGSPLLANYNRNRGYEISDTVTLTEGRHAIKVGGRFRPSDLSTQSTSNFNGTYSFATPTSLNGVPLCLSGIANPTSLDVYQRTLQLLQQGQSMVAIQAAGCGPSQFTLNSGVPVASVSQFDMGLFAQDDFRLRPNLTLSGGVRYETQTNVADHFDMAPRGAISWAPTSKGKAGKTVFRLGWGMFFDRFSAQNTLQTERYDGVSQQNYNITTSTSQAGLAFFPNLPPTSLLALQNQAIYKVDSNLKSSYLMQTAFSVERSLPGRTSLSVSIADSRGVHDLRTRNINAYLPGTYNPLLPLLGGTRPIIGQGDIYLYEDSGIYKQFQVITNVSTRVNSHVSLNGYYAYGHYNTNVIGLPSNQYDTSIDYGRANGDVHHRAFIGGSVGLPFRFTASPIIQMSSAPPFNITTGTDLNGDGIYNDRPSYAPAGATCGGNIKCTSYGNFNVLPAPGDPRIPVNDGIAFPRFSADVRLSRTWGWGERKGPGGQSQGGGGGFGGPGGGPGGGGPGGGGGGRGGGGFGGPGGFGGFGSVGSASHRFNVTFTVSANNVLNHVNQSAPQGALNSPFFGQVLSTGGGGFGGGGGGGGMGGGGFGGGSATGNRRIQFQLRFAF